MDRPGSDWTQVPVVPPVFSLPTRLALCYRWSVECSDGKDLDSGPTSLVVSDQAIRWQNPAGQYVGGTGCEGSPHGRNASIHVSNGLVASGRCPHGHHGGKYRPYSPHLSQATSLVPCLIPLCSSLLVPVGAAWCCLG